MLSQQPCEGSRVSKEVESTNSFENIGCSCLYYIANNCNETESDGTATVTVFARCLYKEGIKSIGSDVNTMDIKIGINICCKYVLNISTKLFCQELLNVHVLHVMQVMVIKQL